MRTVEQVEDELTTDWRGARKAKTKQRIQEVAVRLFSDQGFDNVTVEEVAAAAGVSHMTVFRHFGTKEQIVVSDDYDPMIVAAIKRRPASESAFDSIEQAISTVLGQIDAEGNEIILMRTQLITTTPALRANLWAGWIDTQELVASALAGRQGAGGESRFALRIASGMAMITAATVVMEWVDDGGRRPLSDMLAEAFAIARAEMRKAVQPCMGLA